MKLNWNDLLAIASGNETEVRGASACTLFILSFSGVSVGAFHLNAPRLQTNRALMYRNSAGRVNKMAIKTNRHQSFDKIGMAGPTQPIEIQHKSGGYVNSMHIMRWLGFN